MGGSLSNIGKNTSIFNGCCQKEVLVKEFDFTTDVIKIFDNLIVCIA